MAEAQNIICNKLNHLIPGIINSHFKKNVTEYPCTHWKNVTKLYYLFRKNVTRAINSIIIKKTRSVIKCWKEKLIRNC